MQGGSCGRGHPSAVCCRLRVGNFLHQHVAHEVGCSPHSLANLGLSGKSAGQTNIHIAVFVALNPALHFHGRLWHHWAGLHAGVNLVAGAVEEAGVNECHTRLRCANAFLQVHRSATLFVHDADLQRVLWHADDVFYCSEYIA